MQAAPGFRSSLIQRLKQCHQEFLALHFSLLLFLKIQNSRDTQKLSRNAWTQLSLFERAKTQLQSLAVDMWRIKARDTAHKLKCPSSPGSNLKEWNRPAGECTPHEKRGNHYVGCWPMATRSVHFFWVDIVLTFISALYCLGSNKIIFSKYINQQEKVYNQFSL